MSSPFRVGRLIESRHQQGNLRLIFRLFKSNAQLLTRKSQASFQIIQVSCEALKIIWKWAWDFLVEVSTPSLIIFLTHYPFHFYSKKMMIEVAIFSVFPRIQNAVQNSSIINCLKENRNFIFVYLILHLGKYYPLCGFKTYILMTKPFFCICLLHNLNIYWKVCTFHYSWWCQF